VQTLPFQDIMAAAVVTKACIVAAMLTSCRAGGDHDAAPAPAPRVAQKHVVDWYIPGAQSDDGHNHDHGTATDSVGENKILSVIVGDTVHFQWTNVSHDVTQMADKQHLDSCNFAGSSALQTSATTATYNMPTSTAGTHYITCSVSGHCAAKQKLIVKVTDAPAVASSASPAVWRAGLLGLVLQMSHYN